MVELKLAKFRVRVRFPSFAPFFKAAVMLTASMFAFQAKRIGSNPISRSSLKHHTTETRGTTVERSETEFNIGATILECSRSGNRICL